MKMFMRNLFRDEVIDSDFLMAINLFNANNQKESYEILFQLWKNTKHPSRKLFFQAILQCSAALQLLDQRKYCGARKVYSCAIKKLVNYSTLIKPFDIRRFIFDVIDYFENFHYELSPESMDLEPRRRPRLYSNYFKASLNCSTVP